MPFLHVVLALDLDPVLRLPLVALDQVALDQVVDRLHLLLLVAILQPLHRNPPIQ